MSVKAYRRLLSRLHRDKFTITAEMDAERTSSATDDFDYDRDESGVEENVGAYCVLSTT